MKKKLLFVIDSLDVAGAEKSLVTLLNLLDYNKYSVDLMLFSHGNTLEELLPKQVNVLPPLKYTKYSNKNLMDAFKYSFKNKDFKILYSRIMYSSKIRIKRYSNPEKARIYWQTVSEMVENNPKVYDIAISYAQGVPTFYVADKVRAMKKIAWVNVSYRLEKLDRRYQEPYYEEYNKVVSVSESTKEVLLSTFPSLATKIRVIYDINNLEFIRQMANLGTAYTDEFKGIRILTIGRLANQKGYDMAIDACKKLKDNCIKFKWYVLGKGPLEHKLKESVRRNGLEDNFIFLGVKSNPYPYIKCADIYVQPSRFEGFGLAIAEARMLNVPVVTTRFDAVYNQMIHGKNGLVVDMDGHSIYEGIMKFIEDPLLKKQIIENLKEEKKGNTEELEKFYDLIG